MPLEMPFSISVEMSAARGDYLPIAAEILKKALCTRMYMAPTGNRMEIRLYSIDYNHTWPIETRIARIKFCRSGVLVWPSIPGDVRRISESALV